MQLINKIKIIQIMIFLVPHQDSLGLPPGKNLYLWETILYLLSFPLAMVVERNFLKSGSPLCLQI